MNKIVFRSMGLLIVLALACGSFYSVHASSVNASSTPKYYVAPNGSDSGGCTSAAPCKTFAKALSFAQPGDTVQIMAGTYSQQLLISKSDINVVATGAVIDGANMSQSLCVSIPGNNVVLDGIKVKNCKSHAIIVFGNNITVQNSTVTNSVLENYPPGSKSSGWGSAFKSSEGSTNVTFLNNLAYKNFGEGFGVTKTIGVTLKGNIAYDNYSVNFYPDNSSNVVMTENLSACSGDPLFNRNGNRPSGIVLGEEQYSGWNTHPRNILITHNIITGCERGFNYWGSDVSGGGLVDVTVEYNTFYGNIKTMSIAYEGATTNTVFHHNIFESSPASWVESTAGITFQNNFWSGSLPTNNTRGANDIAGNPQFATAPAWDDANTFLLKSGSPACGYGRWACEGTIPVPPTTTPVPPTATPVPTETAAPPTPVIVPTNQPASETIYDDKDGAFVYSAGWKNVNSTDAYQGSFKKTTKNGSSVTLGFTGQSFSVLYRTSKNFRNMDVYVDEAKVATINQFQKAAFQVCWEYPGQLPYGNHTLKLVFVADPSESTNLGSLDAVIVR